MDKVAFADASHDVYNILITKRALRGDFNGNLKEYYQTKRRVDSAREGLRRALVECDGEERTKEQIVRRAVKLAIPAFFIRWILYPVIQQIIIMILDRYIARTRLYE